MWFKNGLDIIRDGRWKREWGMDRGSIGGGREGGRVKEACCFKSRGDNREDEKSMEGSMKEMSF